MLLLHGEAILFELGELLGVLALVALVLYAEWHSIRWWNRN